MVRDASYMLSNRAKKTIEAVEGLVDDILSWSFVMYAMA